MFYEYVQEELETYVSSIRGKESRDIIEYSITGGKCIRAYIVKHLMETLGGFSDWRPVASIEAVHASSLILDDLPCMDNDRIRRGKPSTFVKYGEGTSILASFLVASSTLGTLIQCLEDFEKQGKITTDQRLNLCSDVTKQWNRTIKKLATGQLMDLKEDTSKFECDSEELDDSDMVNRIIGLKTASLFSMAFSIGALFSCKEIESRAFENMGYHFGIMFQIMDDFHDAETDEDFKNYVLSKGREQAFAKYEDCKAKLLELMESNDVSTPELKHLIGVIDCKMPSQ